MTSYSCEQNYLRDQIRSNNLAIKYLEKKIGLLNLELAPDHIGTEEKVQEALEGGIKFLKADSREKRKCIKELDASDANHISP